MSIKKRHMGLVTAGIAAAFLIVPQWLGAVDDSGARTGAEKVRKPAVAGAFYSVYPKILNQQVAESLKKAKEELNVGGVKAIMAPHAGYMYCGASMAAAYKQVQNDKFRYDTVFLMGPCHGFPTKAAAVSSADSWDSPLGRIPVDTALAKQLVECDKRIEFDDRAHMNEHCLEVQLPYLIHASGGRPFKIVPVLTNSRDPKDHEILAKALVKVAGKPGTLIVLSTDLSHYPSADSAEKVDRAVLGAVKSLSVESLNRENDRILKEGHAGLSVTMCGLEPASVLLLAALDLGITTAAEVSYTHSGMVSGEIDRVVGYGAMVFAGKTEPSKEGTGPIEMKLSDKTQEELIQIARSAVKDAVEGKSGKREPNNNPELQVMAGCFVTLKTKGQLRGCIGTFSSGDPLWKTVGDMAASSATGDPRFRDEPITSDEIPRLDVEISVLSPLKLIRDPLKEIRLGIHGIVVEGRGGRGTFLPQVATETGWSLEQFLGHCSRDKAGIGWDGWKSPKTKIYIYSATIIHESKTEKE
jgi:MEMO1 family protein